MHIVILEDNEDRRTAMLDCLRDLFPQYPVAFFATAAETIRFLALHLAETLVVDLDHDLEMVPGANGRLFDPGTGRDVADYLATQPRCCPVVIHTTNGPAAIGMEQVLGDAGWRTYRIAPYGDLDWIGQVWRRTMRNAIVSAAAPPQRRCVRSARRSFRRALLAVACRGVADAWRFRPAAVHATTASRVGVFCLHRCGGRCEERATWDSVGDDGTSAVGGLLGRREMAQGKGRTPADADRARLGAAAGCRVLPPVPRSVGLGVPAVSARSARRCDPADVRAPYWQRLVRLPGDVFSSSSRAGGPIRVGGPLCFAGRLGGLAHLFDLPDAGGLPLAG
jgi:hypothetical protein